jgi:peptidylprolyl isomerase domain and WD repeat-containing protein 1
MAASSNPLLAEKAVRDPILFSTGYKRQRFYMFTRSEPEYARSRIHSRHRYSCLY